MTVENISIAVKATGADTAARHINSLAAALKNLEKSSAVVTASSDLSALASALQRFSGISIDVRGVSGFARSIDSLSTALKGVSLENLEAIERISGALSGLNGFRGSTTGIANGIQSLSVSLKHLTDEDIERLEKISNVLSGLNGVNLSGLSGASNALRSMSTEAQGAGNSSHHLSNSASRASRSVRSLGDSAKHSVGMLGKLWASIKRIAFYRLLRTFIKELSQGFQEGLKHAYAFSRGITGSLAQALDHLASVSGQMKNQMGAAFGELLQTIMPIIEAIVAAITQLMTALSALFAALGGRAKYLSAGEDEAAAWDKASGAASKYKKTILGFDEINRLNDKNEGGGGGADSNIGKWELADLPDWAEKIRQAIEDGDWEGVGSVLATKFNELIDRIDTTAAGKKLGAKITNAIRTALGFLDTLNLGNVGVKINGFFDGLLGGINLSKFGDLGGKIGEKLNELIGSIDAHSIGQSIGSLLSGAIDFSFEFLSTTDFESIGGKIAEFFNGLFDTVDWEKLGQTIVLRFTSIFDTLIGFVTNLDTLSLGKAISDFISGAFTQATNWLKRKNWSALATLISYKILGFIAGVDWANVATKISNFLKEAFESAKDFVENVKWGEIAKATFDSIIDFLDNIDWNGITTDVGDLLVSAFNGATEFIQNIDWKTLGSKLFDWMDETISGIDWAALAESFFKLLGAALAGAVTFVFSFLKEAWDSLMGYFKGFIEDENNDGQYGAAEVWKGFGKGLLNAIKNVGIWIYENIVKPFIEGFKSAFGIASPAKEMEEPGQFVGEGILQGILKPFKDILGWIKENIFEPFTNGFKEAFGLDGEPVSLKNLGEKVIDGILGGLKETWSSITNFFQEKWDALKLWWENLSLDSFKIKMPHFKVSGSFNLDPTNFSIPSIGIDWYANGGVHDLSMGSLFVAGEAGAEIVTNMGNGKTGVTNVEQMKEAVREGNFELLNVLQGGINLIVNAINEIDPDITLDGQSLADKMYHYNQQAATRYGAAMVT